MDSHKRILGILHLVWGALTMLILFAVSIFFSFIMLNIYPPELDSFEFGLVRTIVIVVCGFVFLVITLPSLIGGIGMLFNQKWAFIVIVISGIFSLLSFPMGTAIGIYTLWAYFKDQELERTGGHQEIFEKRNN